VRGLSVPDTVLSELVHELLDHLDSEPGVGNEHDSLFDLDVRSLLDGGRELAGESDVSSPSDGLAVEHDGLLVEVTLGGGVPQSTLLSQLLNVLGVSIILRTDEDQRIEVSRSTSLKGELSGERSCSGLDATLDRSNDL
jgi:hypothetical protein